MGRPAGWDQGTVRDVIVRPIYRGRFEYLKTRKKDPWGKRKTLKRPPQDLIVVDKPEWRIVPVELEAAVDSTLDERRRRYLRGAKGQLLGRPTLGKYLLTGLLPALHAGLSWPAGADVSVSRPDDRGDPTRPHLLQRPEGESQPRVRGSKCGCDAGRRAHLARDLHAVRFGLLRRSDVSAGTD